MKRKLIIAALFCLIIPLLSGCWNKAELTDIAFVMAVGVDKANSNHGYRFTFQIVIPGNVSTGQTGGGGQGLPVVVHTANADNMLEAAMESTKKIPRQLYFAHTTIFAISEDVAREGIVELLDFLERDPEIRTTTEVVIAKGTTAENIISTLTPLDKIPANKLTKALESTEERWGQNFSVDIDEIISGLVSTGKEPVISGFKLNGSRKTGKKAENLQSSILPAVIEASGLAVFKDGKLIDWINGENARGVSWILKKVKTTAIYVNWKGKKEAIGMKVIRGKTKISASVKNGKPAIHIDIVNEGSLADARVPIDVTSPQKLKETEKAFAKEIKKEVMGAVRAAQKQKSDIFGFGETIHRADPPAWRKMEADWNTQFSELEVDVNVKTYIRRAGVRTVPFMSKMKK